MSWQKHDYTMSSHFLPIHGNLDTRGPPVASELVGPQGFEP